MANEVQDWWNSLPVVTKYLFALSFGLTLAANFGFVNPKLLIFNVRAITVDFEIWRLVTCFFFHGGLGFNFLIHMLFLVRYGQSLEQTTFSGRTGDFVFFLLFGSSILLIIASFLQLPILGMCLIMMLIYLWSRKNPNINMSFMFGIRFQSFYFPWVLVVFNLLMGGFPLAELIGIIVGHVYFFLEDVYPNTGGVRLLKTPQIFYNWFPQANIRRDAPRQAQGQPQPRGYQWGQGYVLGQQPQ